MDENRSDDLANASDVIEIEFRMRHRDGDWIWILSRSRVTERNVDGPFKLNSITKNELKIFPTVIQSSATINIDMAEKTNGLLLITDYSGRPVRQQPITLQSGRNSITIDGFEKYSSGNYIVAVRTNSALYSTKMIIQ